MRRKIVAGNWKMNNNFIQAEELLGELAEKIENDVTVSNVDIVICPPALYMEMASDLCVDDDDEQIFSIGLQNVSEFANGAFTGEISAEMLSSMEIEYCIIGHSERRKYFAETDIQVLKKAEKLLEQNIIPIVCCGEALEERENGTYKDVIKSQLENSIFKLEALDFAKIIIAYEPIWAIGTGKTATPEQAQEIHAFIRESIQSTYGKELARKTPILYGGSCNAKNASELFAQEDIDGGLIGGASLKAEDFVSIVNSF